MCCSVLQCVAVYCSVLHELHRHIYARMTQLSVLQCVAVGCSLLCELHRHISAHITRLILLQCVAVCCSEFYFVLHELHRHISAQLTRLTHMCVTLSSHACHDSFMYVPCHDSAPCHGSIKRLASLLHMCATTNSICGIYVVYHGSAPVTSRTYMCAVTHSYEP